MKRVGVCAIPNLCSTCHRFKPWDELITHFVPDTDYSSEDQSWRECVACAEVAKDCHPRSESRLRIEALLEKRREEKRG